MSCLMLSESAEGKLWLEPQVLVVSQQLLKCMKTIFWFAQASLLPHFKQIMAFLSDTFEPKRRRKETSFCTSPPPQHFHPLGVVSAEQLRHRGALPHSSASQSNPILPRHSHIPGGSDGHCVNSQHLRNLPIIETMLNF